MLPFRSGINFSEYNWNKLHSLEASSCRWPYDICHDMHVNMPVPVLNLLRNLQCNRSIVLQHLLVFFGNYQDDSFLKYLFWQCYQKNILVFLNDIFLFLFPVWLSKEIFFGAVRGPGGSWSKNQTHILSCLPYNSYIPALFHILGINQIIAACKPYFLTILHIDVKFVEVITFM